MNRELVPYVGIASLLLCVVAVGIYAYFEPEPTTNAAPTCRPVSNYVGMRFEKGEKVTCDKSVVLRYDDGNFEQDCYERIPWYLESFECEKNCTIEVADEPLYRDVANIEISYGNVSITPIHRTPIVQTLQVCS